MIIGNIKDPIEFGERFWAKVDRNGPIPAHCPELGPCWIWTAGTNKGGYGLSFARYKSGDLHGHPASRIAFLLASGIIDDELLVCHTCDNPPCCNPAHLFQGTYAANVQDAIFKGRINPTEGGRPRKFSPEREREITDRYMAGEAVVDLATCYGLNRDTINRIVKRNGGTLDGPGNWRRRFRSARESDEMSA